MDLLKDIDGLIECSDGSTFIFYRSGLVKDSNDNEYKLKNLGFDFFGNHEKIPNK